MTCSREAGVALSKPMVAPALNYFSIFGRYSNGKSSEALKRIHRRGIGKDGGPPVAGMEDREAPFKDPIFTSAKAQFEI